MPTGPRPRLPLFPLPNVVHFPRTELRLHVFEPRYRRLVRDLEEREEQLRWIGMVLLRPEPERVFGPPPRIFPEGTAGLLVDVQPLPEGSSNIPSSTCRRCASSSCSSRPCPSGRSRCCASSGAASGWSSCCAPTATWPEPPSGIDFPLHP